MSRTGQRREFDSEVRLALLETDADEADTAVDGLRQELKATNRILLGLLVSVSTAAILFAVNIVIGAI